MSDPHERTAHENAQEHHHHTHAAHSHHGAGHHLLQVEHLSVSFRMYESDAPFFAAQKVNVQAIRDLSLAVHEGEIVAVVGASGSGKTLVADAIMGLFEPNATVTGRVWFDGVAQTGASLAALRGRGISLVPQSVNHLDPMMKVGRQVEECVAGAEGQGGACRGPWRSSRVQKAARRARREELFARYGLAPEVANMYPHELSGGMARRVLLCCALMETPKVIVADEPTPGLDLDLAVRALDDFRAFASSGGGVLLITHDIELALRVADRVAVFKDGTVIEETSVEAFKSPDTLRHPFTKELWHALPSHGFKVFQERSSVKDIEYQKDTQYVKESRSEEESSSEDAGPARLRVAVSAPASASAAALESARAAKGNRPAAAHRACLEARDISFSYPDVSELLYDGLSLAVEPGQRVALSAPSGFGKTSLCKILAGYLNPSSGQVLVDGDPLPKRGANPVQMIFQHPERAVDPRMRLGATLAEGGQASSALLEELGIKPAWLSRFPHELSGGELQRFCIARALAANPRYLIADEMSTMLDAVTQAHIWQVLLRECERRNLGLLFVSHSPELTERIATETVCLHRTSRMA